MEAVSGLGAPASSPAHRCECRLFMNQPKNYGCVGGYWRAALVIRENVPARRPMPFTFSLFALKGLTRISHQLSTAAADPGMPTALRSFGLLDILSRLPAGPSEVYIFTLGAKRQAPCPSAPPRYETW